MSIHPAPIRLALLASARSIHTIRWANALADEGLDVHLLTLHAADDDRFNSRVILHRCPIRRPLGYITARQWARKILDDIAPHLLHAHYASGYGTLACLVGYRPLLVSVWGADVYSFPRRSPLHRWLIRRTLTRADRVLSTSRSMAEESQKYTTREVLVTPFGVDTRLFRPKHVCSLFAPDDIVIGTVKTLARKYGVNDLIECFAIVLRRHPGLPLRLLIVGDGPDRTELESLASKRGVAERVTFAGHVDHQRVPDFHNMLSIFVALSVDDSESFGVAAVEAAACGKPVVVSDVSGFREVVDAGVTGFVVPRRNPAAAAEQLERLLLDQQLRERMGSAGRLRVETYYDWRHSVRGMVELYDSVLTESASRPSVGAGAVG